MRRADEAHVQMVGVLRDVPDDPVAVLLAARVLKPAREVFAPRSGTSRRFVERLLERVVDEHVLDDAALEPRCEECPLPVGVEIARSETTQRAHIPTAALEVRDVDVTTALMGAVLCEVAAAPYAGVADLDAWCTRMGIADGVERAGDVLDDLARDEGALRVADLVARVGRERHAVGERAVVGAAHGGGGWERPVVVDAELGAHAEASSSEAVPARDVPRVHAIACGDHREALARADAMHVEMSATDHERLAGAQSVEVAVGVQRAQRGERESVATRDAMTRVTGGDRVGDVGFVRARGVREGHLDGEREGEHEDESAPHGPTVVNPAEKRKNSAEIDELFHRFARDHVAPNAPIDPERAHAIQVRFLGRLSWWAIGAAFLTKFGGLLATRTLTTMAGALLIVAFVALNLPAYRVIQRASREGATRAQLQLLSMSLGLRVLGLIVALAVLSTG